MLRAIRFCREKKVPYFGLCYGMQMATIEFARNVAGLRGANTAEVDPTTAHPVIHIMPSQEEVVRAGKYGGSQRLGEYACIVTPGTLAAKAYGAPVIRERHRHRYEVNNDYVEKLRDSGLTFSGTSPDGKLMEMIEIKGHPFFVGSQFHPELLSRPLRPHPLFMAFVKASMLRGRK
jgi:CTP synthase